MYNALQFRVICYIAFSHIGNIILTYIPHMYVNVYIYVYIHAYVCYARPVHGNEILDAITIRSTNIGIRYLYILKLIKSAILILPY